MSDTTCTAVLPNSGQRLSGVYWAKNTCCHGVHKGERRAHDLAMEGCSVELQLKYDFGALKLDHGGYEHAVLWLWRNPESRAIFDKYGLAVETLEREMPR